MKTTVSKSDFRDAFHQMDRDNFSYAGLGALYDFVEELDEDCDTESELDVIAFCCDYVEYENLAAFHEDYDKEDYPDRASIDEVTALISIDSEAFIIACF